MAKSSLVLIHPDLVKILAKIQDEVKQDIASKWNLEKKDINVHGTLASQLLAAHYNKIEAFKFELKKTKGYSATLKLVY